MNINAQQVILNANISNNSSLTTDSKFDFEMRESLPISKLKFKTYP